MYLSKLTFLCIKNAVYYDDSSFTYDAFVMGKFNNDPDYSTNIHNAFSPLNMAISRLNDLNKLPFQIFKVDKPLNYTIELSTEIAPYIKEIMKVAAIEDGGHIRPLKFVYINGDKTIQILSKLYSDDQKIAVEYKKDIPYFSNSTDFSEEGAYYEYLENIDVTTGASTPTMVHDVDLKDFGINDSMCNYIVEYVRGCLIEPIDITLANIHLSRAEQYFNNIQPYISPFNQTVVEREYSIGE